MDLSLFHTKTWEPLAQFGLSGTYFTLNAETLIYTWIGLGILTIFGILGRIALAHPHSIGGYITISVLKSFQSMVIQAVNRFEKKYFFFIASIFIFIFICNALVLLPWMEEPTKDINTTIALGLISFFYTQKETLLNHGFAGYFYEYFKMPFTLFPDNTITIKSLLLACIKGILNIISALLLFPLELLGKVASIVSLALRLFGNIFGSSVIGTIFNNMTSGSSLLAITTKITSYNMFLGAYVGVGLLATTLSVSLVISLFFGLFESFIQAFVFSILTMTYISMGVPTTSSESKD